MADGTVCSWNNESQLLAPSLPDYLYSRRSVTCHLVLKVTHWLTNKICLWLWGLYAEHKTPKINKPSTAFTCKVSLIFNHLLLSKSYEKTSGELSFDQGKTDLARNDRNSVDIDGRVSTDSMHRSKTIGHSSNCRPRCPAIVSIECQPQRCLWMSCFHEWGLFLLLLTEV